MSNQQKIAKQKAKVPAREKWLFENQEALTKVKRGLADAKQGRLVKRSVSYQDSRRNGFNNPIID